MVEWHVKSTTKAQQGLYEYDAASRLRASRLGDARGHDVKNYIRKGKLWQAFAAEGKVVLLINEIDKADIEFPNDLLQELDRMEFHIYETGETIRARHRPVIIIPSNKEKELPDAFLRHCFFHYIRFPGTFCRNCMARFSRMSMMWHCSNGLPSWRAGAEGRGDGGPVLSSRAQGNRFSRARGRLRRSGSGDRPGRGSLRRRSGRAVRLSGG